MRQKHLIPVLLALHCVGTCYGQEPRYEQLMVLLRAGQNESALSLCTAYVEVPELRLEMVYWRSVILYRLGRIEEAKYNLTSRTSRLHTYRYLLYFLNGENSPTLREDAIEARKDLVEGYGEDFGLTLPMTNDKRKQFAIIALCASRHSRGACADFGKKAYELWPQAPLAKYVHGKGLLEQGKFDETIAVLDKLKDQIATSNWTPEFKWRVGLMTDQLIKGAKYMKRQGSQGG